MHRAPIDARSITALFAPLLDLRQPAAGQPTSTCAGARPMPTCCVMSRHSMLVSSEPAGWVPPGGAWSIILSGVEAAGLATSSCVQVRTYVPYVHTMHAQIHLWPFHVVRTHVINIPRPRNSRASLCTGKFHPNKNPLGSNPRISGALLHQFGLMPRRLRDYVVQGKRKGTWERQDERGRREQKQTAYGGALRFS